MMDEKETNNSELDLDSILMEFLDEPSDSPEPERSDLPPLIHVPGPEEPDPEQLPLAQDSLASDPESQAIPELVLSELTDLEQGSPEISDEPEQPHPDSMLQFASNDLPEPAESFAQQEPALEGNTVRFSPITDEQLQEAMAALKEKSQQAPVPQQPQEPPVVEPAFEVEEEFIPSPALFTTRSHLMSLKKKLVAGPEKKYYELSEIGTLKLQMAILANFVVVLICIGVTVLVTLDMVPENRLKLVIFSQILAMLVSALFASQLMIDSVWQVLHGRFTVNTLLTLSFFVCIADALYCLKELRIPCCAAFSLEVTFALFARLQERNTKLSQLDTLRKANSLHGMTRVKDFYSGKDAILRDVGKVDDFMNNYEKMSGPQFAQSIYALIAMLVCICIFLFTLYAHGLSMAIQIFSTSLLVAVPASFFVSISRPTAILEQRLHNVGTVLCGWQGVKGLFRKAAFPIYDQDLFPAGSIKFNGVKFYGDEDPEDVIAFSTSLIHVSGSSLVSIFERLLNDRNGILYNVKNFRRYDGGGIGGEVHGVPVLLGNMNFLQDMGVEIPDKTTVSQAVYAAIDGQFSAVFAISYAKMHSASAGLGTLCSSHKNLPILICDDFMLTEDFIRAKFNVKTQRIVFPDQDAAKAMRHVLPDASQPSLALATRPDLIGSTTAVSGARALATAARLGVIIHILGGILGILIMLALAILGNTDLLTPTNVLLYQLIWAVPGLLVTEWTRIL